MNTDRPLIRILLADSHGIFRLGLRHLLERESDFRVVGEAADCGQAVSCIRAEKPDILLIEEEMFNAFGADLLRLGADNGGLPRMFIMGTLSGAEPVEAAFRMGAWGFAPKELSSQVLIDGIRSIMAGTRWAATQPEPRRGADPKRRTGAPGKASVRKPFGLTRRELEVINAIVAGFSNRLIATRFKISEDTVKHHVTNIFDKTGVYNRLELALFAIHHGLTRTG